MPSHVRRKDPSAPPSPRRPWLSLPKRPDATEEQTVRLYMPDQVVELETNDRGIRREMGLDQAAMITVDVVDPPGDLASLELLDADEDMLLDGIDLRWGSVWWRIARLERTDDGWSIQAEDRVAALLRSHRRQVKASREKMTRAQFVYQLVRGVKAEGGIVAYIPELRDTQKIARAEEPAASAKTAKRATSRKTDTGWGSAGAKVRIKGRPATARQLQVLNDAFTEARRLGASRRVCMAVDMALTQESEMGTLLESATGLHHGPLHQSAAWGGTRNRDTASAVRAFLTLDRGPGVQGWKAQFGSLHNGTGDLGQMIDKIQIAGTPDAFGRWEAEAARNFDLWSGRNGGVGKDAGSEKATAEFYRAQFQFKTSDSGERANWWDSTGQLASDVRWHRWAAGNTFGYASDDELIRGEPVLFLSRDLPEVVRMPWTWDYRREASELPVTLLLKDEWQLLPGMTVMVDAEAAVSGRWIVDKITDEPLTAGGEVEVTLRRRGAKKLEPAPEVRQRKVKEKKAGARAGGKASYGGGPVLDEVKGLTPKEIIDRYVLPLARLHDMVTGVSPAGVAAANGRHGPTVNGTRSDHQGPPNFAWAADMSNGTSPTPQMDALAKDIAKMLKIRWSGSGAISATHSGYRFQLIYRVNGPQYGGNHMNHVHLGVRRVTSTSKGLIV